MPELTVKRWRRYGKDRLYVNLDDGSRVGWLDLQTDEVTLERQDLREAFERALAEHRRADEAASARSVAPVPVADPPSPPPSAPPVQPPGAASPELQPGARSEAAPDAAPAAPTAIDEPFAITIGWRDLSTQDAGKAAAEQARAERDAAPVRTMAARLLRVHTEERAWRIGAKGERLVGERLERLPDTWRVLHAVPVGERGADIDHVAVGPGGVFTINAKHHPNAKVWVGGSTFMVNGHRQPYVRNSRHETKRASRLLSKALGWSVEVTGVIAVVGAHEGFVVKEQPEDVHVVTRKRVAKWLASQPARLSNEQVEAIYDAARRSDTWRS